MIDVPLAVRRAVRVRAAQQDMTLSQYVLGLLARDGIAEADALAPAETDAA